MSTIEDYALTFYRYIVAKRIKSAERIARWAKQKHPDAHLNRLFAAELAEARGHLEMAEQLFCQIAETPPVNAYGWSSIAHMFMNKQLYDRATPYFRKALTYDYGTERDEVHCRTYDTLLLAECLLRLGQRVEGLDLLRQVPDDFTHPGYLRLAWAGKAELLRELGLTAG